VITSVGVRPPGKTANNVDGSRDGHRDFKDGNAAGLKSIGDSESLFFGVGAQHWNQAYFADFLDNL
jgi:hypothetical protein